MQVCVDTHSLIWYATDQTKKLGKNALSILKLCEENKTHQLLIPILVLVEAYHASFKKNTISFSDLLLALKSIKSKTVPFDHQVLKACYRLPQEINIHDRIITATALTYRCPLITKDRTLAKQTSVKVIW